MGTVTVIGSSNLDLVIHSRSLPQTGETVTGGEFYRAFGGKGANQAVAAARAGAEARFIGCVGDDSFGTQMLENLDRDGISTEGVSVCREAASGVALIMVDEQGENIISVAPGANRYLTPEHIDRYSGLIEQSDALLLQLEIPLETVYAGIEKAAQADVSVILNPAPVPEKPLDRTYFGMVSCLLPNRGELGTITGLTVDTSETVERAAGSLLETGAGAVVVTMGSEGVCFRSGTQNGTVAARAVKSVDTVGAGDCFAGCFAAAMAQGHSLDQAAAFGNAGAALSVTTRGAQPSMPVLSAIQDML